MDDCATLLTSARALYLGADERIEALPRRRRRQWPRPATLVAVAVTVFVGSQISCDDGHTSVVDACNHAHARP